MNIDSASPYDRLLHPRSRTPRRVWAGLDVSLRVGVVLTAMLVASVLPGVAGAESDPESNTSDTLCGPFDSTLAVAAAPSATADSARNAEAGISAAVSPAASAGEALDPGEIVRLPAAQASNAGTPADSSEAILALPKNEAGQIPTDFELGPGASIRESFFSPVICASVALVTGPSGATLEQLVTVVPEGAALVANDVYASAAAEMSTLSPTEGPPRPDPYASLQYGLAISGVREARELSAGAGVTIALLDSAPESDHQDLARAEVRSIALGEAPQVGVHGTLMAGVMTAIEGNGFGIVGLAPDARLVSIPICTPSGRAGGKCTIYQLLMGLDQAWDAEAQIVNLSLSGPPNILLERGVARLEELGAVVVAAAGNEGTDDPRYPAAYPTVIGVGAVDRDGRRFDASNRGSWVELAAPGVNVLSTVPGNAFAFGNGTSLAAAHVTGVLAVVTGVTRDAKLARAELFRTAQGASQGRTPPVPNVCDVFARLPGEMRRECVPAGR